MYHYSYDCCDGLRMVDKYGNAYGLTLNRDQEDASDAPVFAECFPPV